MDWLEVMPDLESKDSGWKLIRDDCIFFIYFNSETSQYDIHISNPEHGVFGDKLGKAKTYKNIFNENIFAYEVYFFGESESSFCTWFSAVDCGKNPGLLGYGFRINGKWRVKKPEESFV